MCIHGIEGNNCYYCNGTYDKEMREKEERKTKRLQKKEQSKGDKNNEQQRV